MIASQRGNTSLLPSVHESFMHSRGATVHGIPVHAIRLPGIVANQSIIFGEQGETLTLQHQTISREAFMPGLHLACQKVMHLKKLVYGLEHLLD
jgi:4-hydroxy-tetrahydrodipicolinate reductase